MNELPAINSLWRKAGKSRRVREIDNSWSGQHKIMWVRYVHFTGKSVWCTLAEWCKWAKNARQAA